MKKTRSRFLNYVERQEPSDADQIAFKQWLQNSNLHKRPEADIDKVRVFLFHYNKSPQILRGFEAYKKEYEKAYLILILKVLYVGSTSVWTSAFLNRVISAIVGRPFYPQAINLILVILGVLLFGFSAILSRQTKAIHEYPYDYYEGIPLTPFFKNTPHYLIAPIFVSLVVLALTIIFSEYEVYSLSINTLLLCSMAMIMSKKTQEWL